MKPTTLGVLGGLLAIALFLVSTAMLSADDGTGDVSVTITPDRIHTSVGQPFSVTIVLENASDASTPEFALHVDVTDPRSTTSVDPEDWTPELTRAIPSVAPGATATETWELTPISGGDFVMFATLLDTGSGLTPTGLAVSNGVPVHADERNSFNPQGVTPLAITLPAVIAAILLWSIRRRRTRPARD